MPSLASFLPLEFCSFPFPPRRPFFPLTFFRDPFLLSNTLFSLFFPVIASSLLPFFPKASSVFFYSPVLPSFQSASLQFSLEYSVSITNYKFSCPTPNNRIWIKEKIYIPTSWLLPKIPQPISLSLLSFSLSIYPSTEKTKMCCINLWLIEAVVKCAEKKERTYSLEEESKFSPRHYRHTPTTRIICFYDFDYILSRLGLRC